MGKQINIGPLIQQFENDNILRTEILCAFYWDIDPNVSKKTIYSRIHALIQKGVIQRVGQGLYKLGTTKEFRPTISSKIKKVNQEIKKQFPYIDFCVWDLSFINDISQHLINYNVVFVDVERDLVNSVYLRLKDVFSKVMLVRNLYDDISEFAGSIVVRPLVTSSPLIKIGSVKSPTIEKILVDLSTDKEFLPFQGSEIYAIYRTTFDKYTINESTMFRYANRKEKKGKIESIINSIKRQ